MDPSCPSSTFERDEVEELLRDINDNGQALLRGQDAARTSLIDKARCLITALETPVEVTTWIAWAEPTRQAALRLSIDLGLFEQLKRGDEKAKTKDTLASYVGGDPKLIARILRHLAAMNVIKEVDVDSYKPGKISNILTIPEYRDAIPFCTEAAGAVFQRLPAYFAEKQYVAPSDVESGPFQYGHDTKMVVWQWRSERPWLEKAFNNHMAGYYKGRPSWVDEGFYPINDRLVQGIKPGEEEVAIVDIGGNLGYDLQELKKKHPRLPGRFVLQDRPNVIETVSGLHQSIDPTAHDFFTEQPVKGARAYYMHSVLHDWPDPECRRILGHVASAMEKGYSKLLINENVIPDRHAHWRITSLDWFMMALAASAERTETEWRELLKSAGFKVLGIWTTSSAVESLIEAVLESDDTNVS